MANSVMLSIAIAAMLVMQGCDSGTAPKAEHKASAPVVSEQRAPAETSIPETVEDAAVAVNDAVVQAAPDVADRVNARKDAIAAKVNAEKDALAAQLAGRREAVVTSQKKAAAAAEAAKMPVQTAVVKPESLPAPKPAQMPEMGTTKVTVPATAPAVSVGDAAAGESFAKARCKSCHNLDSTNKKVGPGLLGVFGRKAGSMPGFNYGTGLIGADWNWDEKHLRIWLGKKTSDAAKEISGNSSAQTRMSFGGVTGETLDNLIAFLKVNK